MRCCRCKLKINEGSWCSFCRKEYNNEYHKSKVGELSLKKSQSKYQKTEKGKEAQKYANKRYLKEQNRIIGGIMTGSEDDFKRFMKEQAKKQISELGIQKSKLYFKTVTLWRETLVSLGRVKGSFNGIWKIRNYKDVKQYYEDGGTYEEFVELCEWIKAPFDEMGADRKTKQILKYISGLIKQSNNASTFRMQNQKLKALRIKRKKMKDQIQKRIPGSKPIDSQEEFGGYNG